MSELDVRKFVDRQKVAVRQALGGEKALIAVSGGVDSTVSAVITHRAIGENLICIFIDDGFMRLGEAENVKKILSSTPLNLPVKVLDEEKRFMEALKELEDAEEKRKAFREAFYMTLSEAAEEEGCRFLVQGTIKADVVETEGGIKTQHNVLEQIGIDPAEKFGYNIIEPVAALYKPDVRKVARYLGAPPWISERQPFPGPGLLVRVVGMITIDKLEELKKATAIVEEELKPFGADQYFPAIFSGEASSVPMALSNEITNSLKRDVKVTAFFLKEKATGVVDGERKYGSILALEVSDPFGRLIPLTFNQLREVTNRLKILGVTRVLALTSGDAKPGYYVGIRAIRTSDFITASTAEIPWSTLTSISDRILSKCSKVSKVFFDVTPKPPATIEFE